MEGVLHQVLSGIASGGIYASVALALVMIYQATHHVNFAQGEMATFSTYIALTLINVGLPYWIAFVLTVVVSFVIGLLIERILMRPMMDAPVLASVGVFIGLLLIINASTGWMFDYMIKTFPTPFPGGPVLFSGYVSGHELGAIVRDAGRADRGLSVLPPHQAGPGDARRRVQSGVRRGWSASASAGCWRWAGASPRRSARSPA